VVSAKFEDKIKDLKVSSTTAIDKSISSVLQKYTTIPGLTRLWRKKIQPIKEGPKLFDFGVDYIKKWKVYDKNIDNDEFSLYYRYLNLLITDSAKLPVLELILLK